MYRGQIPAGPWVRSSMGTLAVLIVILILPALPALSSEAPDFTLPGRDSSTVSLDSLRGKVVMVDFWASWCEPCRRSFPWLSSLQDQYRNQGLVIIGINLDKKREAADNFLNRIGARFSIAFDPAAKTAQRYNVKGMPTTFILDRTGQVVYSHIGFDDKHAHSVEALLPNLLAK